MFNQDDLDELVDWPYDVLGDAAYFLKAGYSYTVKDNREFSDTSAGIPISRLVSRQIIATHIGQLLLNDKQLAYFEWWYYNKINAGTDWFKINLMTGAGMNKVPAMFNKDGKGQVSSSNLYFTIPCQLTAIELPIKSLSEEDIQILAINGTFTLQNSLEKFSKIIHEAW